MINTVTLNPALDKILYLEKFERNITNRILDAQTVMGGKGTHVSINLRCLEMPNRAFGVCHGQTGARVVQMLRDAGVDSHFLHNPHADDETRTNYLMVEKTGDCSIIAERGVALTKDDCASLIDLMKKDISSGDCLVLSGDSSNCNGFDFFEQLFLALRDKNVKIFVDTSGDSLAHCKSQAHPPYMIKPNLDELSTLCGKPIALDEYAVRDAVLSLEKYGIPIIAVSLGGAGAVVRANGEFYRALPPKVTVRNTIGCGDSFLAGFVYGVEKGLDFEAILRTAIAVSAATAESDSSVGFNRERAKNLEAAVEIRRL